MLLDIFWIGSACVCYLAQIFVFHIFVFIKAKVSWTPVCPGLVLPVFANTPRPLILANSISIWYYLNKVIFKYCLILDKSILTHHCIENQIPWNYSAAHDSKYWIHITTILIWYKPILILYQNILIWYKTILIWYQRPNFLKA